MADTEVFVFIGIKIVFLMLLIYGLPYLSDTNEKTVLFNQVGCHEER